jgi:hypothetical protein
VHRHIRWHRDPCWLPWPSAENFIDYADLAHVASAGVVVGYLVAAPNVGKTGFQITLSVEA